jgi:hypothetical protein
MAEVADLAAAMRAVAAALTLRCGDGDDGASAAAELDATQ